MKRWRQSRALHKWPDINVALTLMRMESILSQSTVNKHIKANQSQQHHSVAVIHLYASSFNGIPTSILLILFFIHPSIHLCLIFIPASLYFRLSFIDQLFFCIYMLHTFLILNNLIKHGAISFFINFSFL